VKKQDVDQPALPETDETLLKSILKGDKKSYDLLMQKHQPAIFNLVHRQLRQREEAEDVVQQVFFQAYQHLEKFRGESKFFTWLYTIALNLVRNHVRQRNLRRMDSLDVPPKNDDSRAPQWPEKSPSPEKIVQDRWELERVQMALENLIEPHRTIFTLHYFQHLSLKEVAARVGRPVGTVKVYLHRSREMLLSQLERMDQPKKELANGL
jgi:RNA polymerase sigma-70 factor, ECF subfamily